MLRSLLGTVQTHYHLNCQRPLILMMTPICPRFLNMINDSVLLRFRARTPEDLSAIEVIYLLFIIIIIHTQIVHCKKYYTGRISE